METNEIEIYLFRLIATMTDIVIKSNIHNIELSQADKVNIEYLYKRFGESNILNSKFEGYIAKADSIVKRWNGNEQEISFTERDEMVIDTLFERYALVTACYNS